MQHERSLSHSFLSGTPCGTAAQVVTSDENHGRLLHIRDFSLRLRPVQLQHSLRHAVAANHVSPWSDTNVNTANDARRCHTMAPLMFITRGRPRCTSVAGFNAGPVGADVNKWWEHLWGEVIHKVRRQVPLYSISAVVECLLSNQNARLDCIYNDNYGTTYDRKNQNWVELWHSWRYSFTSNFPFVTDVVWRHRVTLVRLSFQTEKTSNTKRCSLIQYLTLRGWDTLVGETLLFPNSLYL